MKHKAPAMMFDLNRNNNNKKRKFKGRTILDHVLSRQPDFDPKRHRVFVNNIPLEGESALESTSGPLDVIVVSPV